MNKLKKGYYRQIPIYIAEIYSDGGIEFYGRNWFWDILVDINVWFDFNVLLLDEIPILIEKDDDEKTY